MVGPSWLPPIASFEQDRSPGCWCISTATLDPAATEHFAAAGVSPFTLHARVYVGRSGQSKHLWVYAWLACMLTLVETPVTGLLDAGGRVHLFPWSTPFTQRYWKVECACAVDAAAKAAMIATARMLTENGEGETGCEYFGPRHFIIYYHQSGRGCPWYSDKPWYGGDGNSCPFRVQSKL